MQTDEDFNIKFVSIIKRHKCLYDKKVPEYRNKDEQEKSWMSISQETRESVAHCKERWRNLRACLSRYIKQQNSPDAQHKPYYLTEHMQFLLPFLRSHRQPPMGSGSFPFKMYSDLNLDIKQSDPDDTNECESNKFMPTPKHRLSDTDTASINYVPDVHVEMDTPDTDPEVLFMNALDRTQSERKRIKLEHPPSSQYVDPDPDMDFFRSIIPDIQTMSAQQKRKFKIGVLELIDDVYVKYPENRIPGNLEPNGYWRKT